MSDPMTNPEIPTSGREQTMVAGRELDAMIAERVMGWDVFRANRELRYTDPSDAMVSHVVPNFSSYTGAAFEVVDAMIADGWFPEVQFNNWGAESWHATFSRSTDDPIGGYGAGTSNAAPLSICIAALKAIASRYDIRDRLALSSESTHV